MISQRETVPRLMYLSNSDTAVSSTVAGAAPGTVANVVRKSISSSKIGDGERGGADSAGADASYSFSTCSKMTFARSRAKVPILLNHCNFSPGWQTEKYIDELFAIHMWEFTNWWQSY